MDAHEVTDIIFRGVPYDASTSANGDTMHPHIDLSFDTDREFRYQKCSDDPEELNGKLYLVYECSGEIVEG